jgi:hypothetical protein
VNVLAVTPGRPFTWTKVVSSEYCNVLGTGHPPLCACYIGTSCVRCFGKRTFQRTPQSLRKISQQESDCVSRWILLSSRGGAPGADPCRGAFPNWERRPARARGGENSCFEEQPTIAQLHLGFRHSRSPHRNVAHTLRRYIVSQKRRNRTSAG